MNVQKITLSPLSQNYPLGDNKKVNNNNLKEFNQANLVGLDGLCAYNKSRFLSPVSFGGAYLEDEGVDNGPKEKVDYSKIVPVTESGSKTEKLQKALYNGLYNLDSDTQLILTNSDYQALAVRYGNLIEEQVLDPDANNLLLIVDERIHAPVFFEFHSLDRYKMVMSDKSKLASFINNGLEIVSDYDNIVPVFNNDELKINKSLDPVIIYNQRFLDNNFSSLVVQNDRFTFEVDTEQFLDDFDVDLFGITAAKKQAVGEDDDNSVEILGGAKTLTEQSEVQSNKPLKPLFKDVGGQKDVIAKIEEEIVFPLVYPEAFGHIMNKGAILCGPPGTGKTYIARALANEVSRLLGQKVNFKNIDGNTLNKSEVGLTEENWRKMFSEARASQPCIIFIDEGDAFTQTRDSSSTARYDNKTVNQILTLMSELEESDDKVFVIMATNKVDMMDSAITRDGRFGVIIDVNLPDKDGCREIFDIHIKDRNPDEALDREVIAKSLVDRKASGAMIAGVIERAFKNSYRRCGIYDKMRAGTFVKEDLNNVRITMDDIQKAIDESEKMERLKSNKVARPVIGFNTNKK